MAGANLPLFISKKPGSSFCCLIVFQSNPKVFTRFSAQFSFQVIFGQERNTPNKKETVILPVTERRRPESSSFSAFGSLFSPTLDSALGRSPGVSPAVAAGACQAGASRDVLIDPPHNTDTIRMGARLQNPHRITHYMHHLNTGRSSSTLNQSNLTFPMKRRKPRAQMVSKAKDKTRF